MNLECFEKSFQVHIPTRVEFGWGISGRVSEVIPQTARHCLFVTQACLLSLPGVNGVRKSVEASGKFVHLYTDLVGEPDSSAVERAKEDINGLPVDVVLAVGGGSVIDFAKAISVALTQDGRVWEYVGVAGESARQIRSPMLPLVALPTTAGTGSEVTPYAVLTNNESRYKAAIVSPLLTPRVALVDPSLTTTMPIDVTAYTGADALAHAVESFLNVPRRTPFSTMIALEAVRAGAKALPMAVRNGADRRARSAMAWTSLMGGLAISMSGTGIAHAMAEVLGGMSHLEHGRAVAVFLLATVRLLEERYELPLMLLRSAFGDGSRPVGEQIESLWKEVGLPLTLPEFGIGRSEIPRIQRYTLDHMEWALSANPVPLQTDDVGRILSYAWSG